jgi:hypothetical protein
LIEVQKNLKQLKEECWKRFGIFLKNMKEFLYTGIG